MLIEDVEGCPHISVFPNKGRNSWYFQGNHQYYVLELTFFVIVSCSCKNNLFIQRQSSTFLASLVQFSFVAIVALVCCMPLAPYNNNPYVTAGATIKQICSLMDLQTCILQKKLYLDSIACLGLNLIQYYPATRNSICKIRLLCFL